MDKIPLKTAQQIAYRLGNLMAPHCFRVAVAGSDNFGVIHFIRTGSTEFNLKMIAALKENGYGFEDGKLVHLAGSKHDNGKALGFNREEFCYEETMIFEKAGMTYIEPQNRG